MRICGMRIFRAKLYVEKYWYRELFYSDYMPRELSDAVYNMIQGISSSKNI